MSHIYDALRKSGGSEPEKPRQTPGDPSPPPAVAARPGSITPEFSVEGSLFGDPDIEFLQELDVLRSSIDVMLGRTTQRVIGFSAAGPDEGATTVAAHYAYLLAKVAEKNVLLVDTDVARSNVPLSEPFGEREGFAELLETDVPLERVVLATEEPRLHFLPAGRDRVHHVEAVSTGALRPLFERLASHYDVIVVDIAPVLRNPEASVIASACDGVVLVVRAHRTRREIVRRAVAELGFAKCRLLGTVLNACQENMPRFLRERV